jgi:hypothetical protein
MCRQDVVLESDLAAFLAMVQMRIQLGPLQRRKGAGACQSIELSEFVVVFPTLLAV